MKPKMTRQRAFTLVEMLVVVGIIVVLATLLIPVFSRVKEGGRKTTCTNNLKQLGMAFQMYLQDSSGRYPGPGNLQSWADGGHWMAGGEGGVPKNYDGISTFGLADPATFKYVEGHSAYPEKGALYPYVKSPAPFVCPSAPDNDKKNLSYSMNCALGGLNSVRVKVPSEVILLVDEGDTINDAYFWATKDANSTDALFKGHNGGGNLLMADGSVNFYQFDALPIDKANEVAKSDRDKIKWRGNIAPKFHDKAFGVQGSYAPAGSPIDACNVSTATPRDWVAEP